MMAASGGPMLSGDVDPAGNQRHPFPVHPMGVSNRFSRRLRGSSCFRGAYGGRVTGLPMLKAGRPQ